MARLLVVPLAMVVAFAFAAANPLPAGAYACGALSAPWYTVGPPNDAECDGYTAAAEQFIGTFEWVTCPATSTPGDEEPDAWPPDFNDDQKVDIVDVNALAPPRFFSTPGDPNYSPRYDITAGSASSDPKIDIFDVNKLAPPVYFSTCLIAPPAPLTATSRYAGDLTGDCEVDYWNFYDYGTYQGWAGELGSLILDFGAQWFNYGYLWGTRDWARVFHSDYDIDCASRGFIDGFYWHSPYEQVLKVGIGTNNSYDVGYSAGQDWAAVANLLDNYVATAGYDVQMSVRGASDMEPDFSGWIPATGWANGYSSSASVDYYDYGSADGCPVSASDEDPGAYGLPCNNGWYQSDIAYVSWESPRARPFPEIYRVDGRFAYQWQQISVYASYHSASGSLTFRGSLTQSQACAQKQGTEQACPPGTDNIPPQGWRQLYVAVNSNPRTASSILYSSDIRWNNP